MRQIGTLPKSDDPQVLHDHLLSLGVSSRAVESKDGWAIWVHDEDLLAKAREEFDAYTASPDDPRFRAKAEVAKELIRQERERDRAYAKNLRSFKGRWDQTGVRRRPLTSALIVVCVAVFAACSLSPEWDQTLVDWLGFFPRRDSGDVHDLAQGLASIHRGQVWRLVTPIFLHFGILHILFNLWALSQAGTLIEMRRGTSTLAALVVLSAVSSNVGEYVFQINFYERITPFGGISGVVYALFGYLWVRGRLHPEDGMALSPSTVRIMLIWLVFGLLGMSVPGGARMANGAHIVGLIIGMMFGMAGY